MGARYYDPTLGRFMGVDPVSCSIWTTCTASIATGTRTTNPYKFVDPDGRYGKLIRPLIKVLKNGGDVRGALKESKTEIVDSVLTIVDGSSSTLDKAAAVFDLLSPVSAGELNKGQRFLSR